MTEHSDHLPALDEQVSRTYSHDYTMNTRLDFSRNGANAQLRLSFSSEDMDMGMEELLYRGQGGESLTELAHDLREDITAYLDRLELYERPATNSIHTSDDYYAEFSRTALYAFEASLKEIEQEKELPLSWHPMPSEKADWLYSDSDRDAQRGCIGHLRGDFGKSGSEFWTNFFDHQPKLKQSAFRDELQVLVDALRKPDGLLNSFSAMSRHCHEGAEIRGSYGFHAESPQYEYCLRCSPIKGDYNFYLYCYDKAAQQERSQDKPSVADQLKVLPTHGSPKPNKTKDKER